MARLSNNLFLLFCIVLPLFGISQVQTGEPSRNDADYKDPSQHEKFYKRRKMIGAWQINQLKNGALVVRLKTNRLAIDELRKAGRNEAATEKELETYAINKNTMLAFMDNFTFCKVYFIPSNFSDSLLNGARSGIFLDTNLAVNPGITMSEKFYLLAERDYGYNSSIGFVPEDSARKAQEKGNAVKQMAVVLKNKYGHQLKAPFPYAVGEKNYLGAEYSLPISHSEGPNGSSIKYHVNRTFLADLENEKTRAQRHAPQATSTVRVGKQFTYEKIAEAVQQLNDELIRYHRNTPLDESRMPEDVKPFLY